MKRVIYLLPILLILASSSYGSGKGWGPCRTGHGNCDPIGPDSSALAGYGDPYGYPQGNGPHYGGGYPPYGTLEVDVETENQPFMRWRHRFDFVLDPVDSSATSDTFPGAAEDSHGFGEWGPSDAGNRQPGNGAPYSGPRP